HLGKPLLACSCHLPACLGGPPFRSRRTDACLFDVAPGRGCRVSPYGDMARNAMQYGGAVPVPEGPRRRLVSVALFLGLTTLARRDAGRPLAATLPCGVRTFLDACAPRLPDPPHRGIVTCDNRDHS